MIRRQPDRTWRGARCELTPFLPNFPSHRKHTLYATLCLPTASLHYLSSLLPMSVVFARILQRKTFCSHHHPLQPPISLFCSCAAEEGRGRLRGSARRPLPRSTDAGSHELRARGKGAHLSSSASLLLPSSLANQTPSGHIDLQASNHHVRTTPNNWGRGGDTHLRAFFGINLVIWRQWYV